MRINKNDWKIWIWLLLVLFLAGYLRFINLNWDDGHYLHPDERLYVNAANIKWPDLNPHMFYYGSLPLYIYVMIFKLWQGLGNTEISFLVSSRMISAAISTVTVGVLYLLARKFLLSKGSLLATLVLALSVGHFQHGHFITTESWLTLEVVLTAYFSVLLLNEKEEKAKWKWAVLAGIFWGLGIATKIVGLSFGIMPVAAVFGPTKSAFGGFRRVKNWILIMIICGLTAMIVGIIGSPYNLIDFQSFWREQSYMQGVTVGKFKPPFVIIYENTKPYIYQLIKIWPWIMGPAGVLAVVGVVGVLRDVREKRSKWLTLLIWPVIYFLAAGIWYAKFSRYMVPLLPFAAILAGKGAEVLLKRKGKIAGILGRWGVLGILGGQIAYAVFFANEVYGKENTRIAASRWIYQNIPARATICGEHWDDNLPLSIENFNADIYRKMELAVYDDDNQQKIDTLLNKTAGCDYIILSSRRVWYSIVRNPDKYPFTSQFYRDLFDERGNFKLVHEERRLNDNGADETFQSYDHPPVLIFEKI